MKISALQKGRLLSVSSFLISWSIASSIFIAAGHSYQEKLGDVLLWCSGYGLCFLLGSLCLSLYTKRTPGVLAADDLLPISIISGLAFTFSTGGRSVTRDVFLWALLAILAIIVFRARSLVWSSAGCFGLIALGSAGGFVWSGHAYGASLECALLGGCVGVLLRSPSNSEHVK